MSTRLRFMLCFLAVGVCLFSLCYQMALAQATTNITNIRMPWAAVQDIPGIGLVDIEYESHLVIRSTTTPSGRVNLSFHANVDHFKGTVVADGRLFHGSQSVHETYNSSDDVEGPFEYTFTVAFTAITQGSADNLINHITFHITMNANGEITAYIDNSWSEYRG